MTLISYLILSAILFVAMVLIQALMGIMHYGLTPLAGSRDGLGAPGVVLDRAKRANANMIEAMVMFVPLAMVAIHTGTTDGLVLTGAALFFWGRLAYAPIYWLGLPWIRPLVWGIALVGIILMIVGLLPLV